MKEESKIEEELKRYLLGQLSEAEERSIEDKYASDPDFPDLVSVVEDDLVDAYVLNRLSPEQHEQFDRFFLASPDNRDKVAFTKALSRNIQESNRQSAPANNRSETPILLPHASRIPAAVGLSWSSASRFALAVLVAMAVVGAMWLVVNNKDSQTRVDQATNDTPSSGSGTSQPEALGKAPSGNQAVINKSGEENVRPNQSEATSAKRDQTGKPGERAVVASFTLSPGLTRSPADTTRIEIPRTAKLVKLKLSLDSAVPYIAYRASLQRVGGGEVWTERVRNNRLKVLRSMTVTAPASLLMNGEYLMTVSGETQLGETEILADYAFSVGERR